MNEPQPQKCGVEGVELFEEFRVLDEVVNVKF